MTTATATKTWKRQDFASDQDVRWCPGCGDYVVLSAVHRTLAAIGRGPHENVFISGIGCSSRFPYYLGTYGFHSVHGRAPAIASGVKVCRPDLSVWIVTGDGDGLSIGANHLLHVLRRNIDVNVLLFNNRIYGLTKGQYSPASEQGKVTKTSPMGSIEQPINPLSFAIASQATFVARTYDADPKHVAATLERAAQHKGVSFVEIYQNCKIFNDGTFNAVTNRDVRSDRIVFLEHGKPLTFGALGNKGITLNGVDPVVVEFEPGNPPTDLLVHDENASVGLSFLLTRLAHPDFPEAMGVFRAVEKPVYEDELHAQIAKARENSKDTSLHALLRRGAETWTIKPPAAEGEAVSGEIESLGDALEEVGPEKDSYIADLDEDEGVPEGVARVLGTELSELTSDSDTVRVSADTPIGQVLEEMRAGDALATVLVCAEDETIVGIVTERDLLHRIPDGVDLKTAPITIVMTPNPEVLEPSDTVAHALNFAGARSYRRVLVVSEEGVTVLTIGDLLDFIRNEAP